ncbi:MAG: hypothetical protein IJE02_03130 [Clostridia bacterium]|nr:hypothetical protein [Clostridia bacterium]
MKKLWQKEYSLRAGDFDKFDRIKPSSILDLFQDAAGQHAEEIGVGFADMMAKNYLWVMTRVKFQIISAPKRYQNVIVKTWPLEPNRLNYRREYCIEDINGNKLVIGSSEWVVLHANERRLLSVPNLYPFTDGFHNEITFIEKAKKVRDFEACNAPYIVNAGFSELDVNDHVNNTKYANYVMDAINPYNDDIIESFQIDYRKEVMQGVKLNIYYTKEDNTILAKGQNDNNEVMFACKIDFKLEKCI